MSFRQWIIEWLQRKQVGKEKFATQSVSNRLGSHHQTNRFEDTNRSLRFDVQSARGGIIMSVHKYDSKRDEYENIVHIIHDDQDVAESIAHIVSMELLRQ